MCVCVKKIIQFVWINARWSVVKQMALVFERSVDMNQWNQCSQSSILNKSTYKWLKSDNDWIEAHVSKKHDSNSLYLCFKTRYHVDLFNCRFLSQIVSKLCDAHQSIIQFVHFHGQKIALANWNNCGNLANIGGHTSHNFSQFRFDYLFHSNNNSIRGLSISVMSVSVEQINLIGPGSICANTYVQVPI